MLLTQLFDCCVPLFMLPPRKERGVVCLTLCIYSYAVRQGGIPVHRRQGSTVCNGSPGAVIVGINDNPLHNYTEPSGREPSCSEKQHIGCRRAGTILLCLLLVIFSPAVWSGLACRMTPLLPIGGHVADSRRSIPSPRPRR